MVYTNDAKLYYEDTVDGSRTLLLLHGNNENHLIFHACKEYFLRLDYRIILMDTRWHGNSGRGDKPLNFSTFANDAAEILKHLKVNNADVIGFSDGANVAIHMCLEHGDLIDSAVLISPNIFPKGLKSLWLIKVLAFFQTVGGLFCKRTRKNAQITKLMTKEPRLDFADLDNIKNRVLLMTGTNDVVKSSHIANIANSIQDCRQEIFDGGHFFFFEDSAPDAMLAAFRFLERF